MVQIDFGIGWHNYRFVQRTKKAVGNFNYYEFKKALIFKKTHTLRSRKGGHKISSPIVFLESLHYTYNCRVEIGKIVCGLALEYSKSNEPSCMTSCEVETSPSVVIEHSKTTDTWFAKVIRAKSGRTRVNIGRTHSYSIVSLLHSTCQHSDFTSYRRQ